MGVSVPELLPSLLNFLTLGKYFFFVLSVFPDFGFKKRKTGRKKKKKFDNTGPIHKNIRLPFGRTLL